MKKYLVFLLPLCLRAVEVKIVTATPTQAVLRVQGYTGSCTLNLYEGTNATGTLHPDVTASVDTSRSDTITHGDGVRLVTLGHQRSNLALATDTEYYGTVTGCGTTDTFRFRTPPPPMGMTMPVQPPVDCTAGIADCLDYPQIDWSTAGKDKWYVDPVTGVKHKPLVQPEELSRSNHDSDTSFTYWAGGSGWTDPASAASGSTSSFGNTSNTNPIFLYPNTIDPFGNNFAVENIGLVVWGASTGATNNDRTLDVCLTRDASTCAGTSFAIVLPSVASAPTSVNKQTGSTITNSGGAFPTLYPRPGWAGWGGVDIKRDEWPQNTTGSASISSGVMTIASPTQTSHFQRGLGAGNHVYVATSGCSANGKADMCTVASMTNASSLTLAETTVSGTKSFISFPYGIMVKKRNTNGVAYVGFRYKYAGSSDVNTGTEAQACSPLEVTDADGVKGHLCKTGQSSHGIYFISNDGEATRALAVPTSPSAFGAQFSAQKIAFSSTEANVMFATDLTGSNFYKLTYNGNYKDTVWSTAAGKYYIKPGGDAPIQFNTAFCPNSTTCEEITWELAISPSLNAQINANPAWTSFNDPPFSAWTSGTQFAGITGDLAIIYKTIGAQDKGPCHIAVVNLVTKTVIDVFTTQNPNTAEGWGAGCHNVGALEFANTLVASHNIPTGGSVVTFTANASTDTLTVASNPFQNGDKVGIKNTTGGNLPGGLAVATTYFVIGRTSTTFQLSTTSGGSAIDVTSAGTGTNRAYYAGWISAGPFDMPILGVYRGGSEHADTCLEWPKTTGTSCTGLGTTLPHYDKTIPAGIDDDLEAMGAVEGSNQGVRIHAQVPCNLQPSAGDFTLYGACPWNSAYSATPGLKKGNNFFDPVPGGGAPGDSEHFRVITDPTDNGDGTITFWAQRNASRFYCVSSDVDLTAPAGKSFQADAQARHSNGWTARMMAGANGACNEAATFYWYPSGTLASKTIIDRSRAYSGHTFLANAPGGKIIHLGGVDADGTMKNYLFDDPTGYGTYPIPDKLALSAPEFQGVASVVGGGGVQSYVDGSQWAAPDEKLIYNLDWNHLNNNAGQPSQAVGNTLPGTRTLTNVTGDIWRTTVINGSGTSTFNYKRQPLHGWVGQYAMKEVSGPSSDITSAPDKSFCYVRKAGECYSGATVGQVYLKVAKLWTGNGSNCNPALYWGNVPCVYAPNAVSGYIRQSLAAIPDTTAAAHRLLSTAFKPLGVTQTYAGARLHPSGDVALTNPSGWTQSHRNTPLVIKLPRWENTTTLRNRLGGVTVKIGARTGMTHARVRFGYNTSFHCTSRNEACLTDGALNTETAPYAFETSDTLTNTSCSGGCTITVPAWPGRLMYYRVETFNGTTWTNGETRTATP